MYAVVQTKKTPKAVVEHYWRALEKSGRIQDRLCGFKNPTWRDAERLIQDCPHSFNVYDEEREILVADFALTTFTGKSAQVHFSMHPENSPQYSMKVARTITDQILNVWHEKDHPDKPFLYSLFGLTPVTNRTACAFVQRVGFKKVGTLYMGQQIGDTYVDALLTIKKRKDNG